MPGSSRAPREVGLDAAVPTCPAWKVRELVAHQTMVHRWATAHVRGEDADAVPNETQILETVPDLSPYYDEGLTGLVAALRDAPPDLEAFTFLKDCACAARVLGSTASARDDDARGRRPGRGPRARSYD